VQNEISNNEKLIFTNYGSPNYHVQVHVHVWVRHAITYLIISVLHGFLQSVDAGGSESDEDGLCEYEKQRLRKIKENRAFLASLNLDTAKEDLKALTEKQVKVCRRCLEQLGMHYYAHSSAAVLCTCTYVFERQIVEACSYLI
jgi:hypothetical protein